MTVALRSAGVESQGGGCCGAHQQSLGSRWGCVLQITRFVKISLTADEPNSFFAFFLCVIVSSRIFLILSFFLSIDFFCPFDPLLVLIFYLQLSEVQWMVAIAFPHPPFCCICVLWWSANNEMFFVYTLLLGKQI